MESPVSSSSTYQDSASSHQNGFPVPTAGAAPIGSAASVLSTAASSTSANTAIAGAQVQKTPNGLHVSHGCVGDAGRATLQLVREAGCLGKTSSEGARRGGRWSCSPLSDLFAAGHFRGWPLRKGADEFSFQTLESWGLHEYDEELQEALYLGEVFYEVKNTFIQYDVPTCPPDAKEWKSSPSRMLNGSFHTKYPKMEEKHYSGSCKPCAYFLYKGDGCRWGEECQFCHLCKRGEIKKRKKDKAKKIQQAKREILAGQDALEENAPGISTPSSAGGYGD